MDFRPSFQFAYGAGRRGSTLQIDVCHPQKIGMQQRYLKLVRLMLSLNKIVSIYFKQIFLTLLVKEAIPRSKIICPLMRGPVWAALEMSENVLPEELLTG